MVRAVLREHLESFLAQCRNPDDGTGLPRYVEEELRAASRCGDFREGFGRARCRLCGHESLVGLSCQSRLACASCATRRMESLAAHLVDRVLPDRPLRQWTLSLPFGLRPLLAADRSLLGAVHRIFIDRVFRSLRDKARRLGVPDGRCGAISFIQRFSGALRANVHFHLNAVDGVFHRAPGGALEFLELPPPGALDLEEVTVSIAKAVRRLLIRRGRLTPEGELCPSDSQEVTPLERLWQASATERIPKGGLDESGRPLIRPPHGLPTLGSLPACDVEGFNLHAGVAVPAGDRDGRLRLVRYGARPAYADDQFSWTSDGRIAFALRAPRRHGATHLFFTPHQLLRRLAWLVPKPYA